ncbi:glutathione peroxidase [Polymorphobacter sp.]|uniref:glutathione peroxidase n=1 Tax=Polymorphobacter sp. TaxID=1909290 RepID=UPI003F72E479
MMRAAAAAVIGVALVAAAPAGLNSAFEVTTKTIDGKPMPWAQYKGKVLLVVNTASFCGYTPQYEGLQALQDRYAAKGFTVIGVPSGDFGDQEYKTGKEIADFCESTYRVKFPMTEKAVVKGPAAAPFYRWAAAKLGADKAPGWNFHKYLVGRDGRLIAAYPSKVTPQSQELVTAINAAIATGTAG